MTNEQRRSAIDHLEEIRAKCGQELFDGGPMNTLAMDCRTLATKAITVLCSGPADPKPFNSPITMQDVLLHFGELSEKERAPVRWVLGRISTDEDLYRKAMENIPQESLDRVDRALSHVDAQAQVEDMEGIIELVDEFGTAVGSLADVAWNSINMEAPTNRQILVANDCGSMVARCTTNSRGETIYRRIGARPDDATFDIGIVGVKAWAEMPNPPSWYFALPRTVRTVAVAGPSPTHEQRTNMKHSQDKSNEAEGQLRQADVMPSRLSRPMTCIRCGNAGELHYVLKWSEAKGRKVDKWMWEQNKFPFMVFFEPGTKHLGWNDRDDRNCDIVPFAEAIGICDWA